MKIGMIGAGAVSKAVATYALGLGHEVIFTNSSGGVRLDDIARGLGDRASAGTLNDVAEADIILLAVPWLAIEDALPASIDWTGRVLIDATNPFIAFDPKLVLADLGEKSASELVAGLVPGAHVIKAFNSVYMERFEAGPQVGDARRVLFVSGDDAGAKKTVSDLIQSFGFAVIDLGSLAAGGRMQQAGGPLGGPDILVAS